MPHLILTRRSGERLRLQHGSTVVEVEVIEVHGQQVKIGIRAPRYVSIERPESAEPERVAISTAWGCVPPEGNGDA